MEQERVAAWVTGLGGSTEADGRRPGRPVVWVDLCRTEVTDTALGRLAWLPSLEELLLVDTKIGDAGLVRLAGLTRLQVLDLRNTEVTDAGLVHLSRHGSGLLAGLPLLRLCHFGWTGVQ
jgi:hypothetical protein